MSSESMDRQQASADAGVPLCVWRDGKLVGAVVEPTDGQKLIDKFQAAGDDGHFEMLLPCHRHPTVPAVDCLSCEPVA